MDDKDKTREELLCDVAALRARVAELESMRQSCLRTEEALIESEARYRRLLESVTDYIYTVRIEDGRVVATTHGPNCRAVTGYTAEEYAADPMLWINMVPEDDREAVRLQAEALLSGIAAQPLEHRIVHKDGDIHWVRNTPVPRHDEEGRMVGYDGIINDITGRKKAEDHIRHLARHDVLTGLPNRQLFAERVREALARIRFEGGKAAVLFVDLDSFKPVNDQHGHAAGDALLRSVARRLVKAIRRTDTVARLGGDEFGVLLPDVLGEEHAARAARAIIETLSRPFRPRGLVCHVGASVGISLAPDHGRDPDTLLRKADQAMYRAKSAGGNDFQFVIGD